MLSRIFVPIPPGSPMRRTSGKRIHFLCLWKRVCSAEKAAKAKRRQKVQDAHEAIRPTDITRTPASLKDSLTRDQFRLYQLIWKRFVQAACSLPDMRRSAVKIGADHVYVFGSYIPSSFLTDSAVCIRKRMKKKRRAMCL